jgi:hypothetical protein
MDERLVTAGLGDFLTRFSDRGVRRSTSISRSKPGILPSDKSYIVGTGCGFGGRR